MALPCSSRLGLHTGAARPLYCAARQLSLSASLSPGRWDRAEAPARGVGERRVGIRRKRVLRATRAPTEWPLSLRVSERVSPPVWAGPPCARRR